VRVGGEGAEEDDLAELQARRKRFEALLHRLDCDLE
jgi:hypothetical protein